MFDNPTANLKKELSRRDFVKRLGKATALVAGASLLPRWGRNSVFGSPAIDDGFDLLVAKGKDYPKLLREGLKLMGWPGRFLTPGAKVVIKPNAAWSRTPEQAANTHPLLVAEMIKLCREGKAGKIEAVEHPCDNYKSAFRISGIEEAVKQAGSNLYPMTEDRDFVPVVIPGAKSLKKAEVGRKILEADVLINMPIAKVHSSAILTMAMKNHMGTVKDRWTFHNTDLNECIADISSFIYPALTVLDCTRILTTNGPKGPGEVKVLNQIILGTDQVAVDAYGTTLFGKKPDDLGYLREAKERGLGKTDLANIKVKEINIA